MRHRFFVPRRQAPEAVVALEGDERHHAQVLRIRVGEEIEIFDGEGNNHVARFESADALHIIGKGADREPAIAIRLAMSVIQLDKFEIVLQKGTELGVHTFIPLIVDRGEVREERIRGKAERWQKIVFEAVKQSGRSRLPRIEPATKFDEVIAREGQKIVFDADADAPSATRQLSNPATLFIGPEGGWSDRERTLARQHGAVFCRLGPRRLRAETAAIAALAQFALRGP